MIPFKAETKTDHCTERRLKETLNFLYPEDFDGWILDIGRENYVGETIRKRMGVDKAWFHNTEDSDLNAEIICPGGGVMGGREKPEQGYNTILCLEVIEHVMNPLVLMEEIHRHLAWDGVVYLSTPLANRFGFMFNETEHFAEYRADKLRALFDYAGFTITREKVFRTIPAWQEYKRVRGIFRTSLRIWSTETKLFRLVR